MPPVGLGRIGADCRLFLEVGSESPTRSLIHVGAELATGRYHNAAAEGSVPVVSSVRGLLLIRAGAASRAAPPVIRRANGMHGRRTGGPQMARMARALGRRGRRPGAPEALPRAARM